MVSECANPGCGAQFLYFGEGKLLTIRRQTGSTSGWQVEFFWLCGDCARHMDLEVTLNGDLHLVSQEPKLELTRA